MTFEINETHDINLKSWVESANAPDADFPIQNLPFCFYQTDEYSYPDLGIAIGDQILDVAEAIAGIRNAIDRGEFDFRERVRHAPPEFEFSRNSSYDEIRNAHAGLETLDYRGLELREIFDNVFVNSSKIRLFASHMLREDATGIIRDIGRRALAPMSEVHKFSFIPIGDYTDFYCSIFHATNVGAMFRPDNPLLPNYKYIPIGYHGRASSIVLSGTDIKRPKGQNRADAEAPPVFIPCKNLDYEMEVGFFVGKGNQLGTPVPIEKAEEHIFGLCLVNDWSARDIQSWEYQPLGPFLAKNFATTVSPFVVTMEALAPFRTAAFERPEGDPQPLDYLSSEQNQKSGGFDINLEVYIQTEKMRAENVAPHLLSRSNMKDLYWTIGQMLTHHASGGCNLQAGDLMATGTVSGKEKNERGCLLELTWRGKEPIELPNGETRRFLEDGDEVIMKAFCEREGFRRIGFGECRGRIISS